MAPYGIYCRQAPAVPQWQTGDIAYLKSADYFHENDHEALIKSNYMPCGATNHPVIILKRCSRTASHVLITPVSAYSSGEFNDYLPPWKQEAHRFKNPNNFRSFAGSERVNYRKPLHLEEGKSMPKPKASWLNIQSVWVVPISVLGVFNKSQEGHLRVRKDSLDGLTVHMSQCCRLWTQRINDPRLMRESNRSAPQQRQTQTQTQTQRQNTQHTPPTRPPTAPVTRTMGPTSKPVGTWGTKNGRSGNPYAVLART